MKEVLFPKRPSVEKQAMVKLEKWFSDEHDRMYAEHDRPAKMKDGLFCAFLESAMRAHDRAWVEWGFYLQDLKVPNDTIRKWRKHVE